MSQMLDGSVAVLWGSSTCELNWIHLSPRDGRVSVAKADAKGFWVRDPSGIANIGNIADQAHWAWQQLRDGADLAGHATHRLAPPHMQDIEPLEEQ